MDQAVVQNQVFRAKQIPQRGDIGGVAADKGNGGVHCIQIGEL